MTSRIEKYFTETKYNFCESIVDYLLLEDGIYPDPSKFWFPTPHVNDQKILEKVFPGNIYYEVCGIPLICYGDIINEPEILEAVMKENIKSKSFYLAVHLNNTDFKDLDTLKKIPYFKIYQQEYYSSFASYFIGKETTLREDIKFDLITGSRDFFFMKYLSEKKELKPSIEVYLEKIGYFRHLKIIKWCDLEEILKSIPLQEG